MWQELKMVDFAVCCTSTCPAFADKPTLCRFGEGSAFVAGSLFRSDSLAERSEFELPVPLSKLSSDSHRVLDVEHSPEKCAKVPRARRSRERE